MTRRSGAKQSRIDLELAGYAFRTPLAGESLTVPARVELSGGQLHWAFYDKGRGPEKRYPGAGLLGEFLALSDPAVTDQAICDFASSYGMLGICRHGVPGHHGRYDNSRGKKTLIWCVPSEGFGFSGSEPVAAWRQQARRMLALLRVSAAVASGTQGDRADWDLLGGISQLQEQSWGSRPEGRRQRVETLLNAALTEADLRVRFEWFGEAPVLRVGGHGLYAALLAQLALELSDTAGLRICSECRRPFRDNWGQRRGKRRFCGDCRNNGAAARAASQALRKRKQLALRLASEGKPLEFIAREMKRPVEQVSAWLAPSGSRRRDAIGCRAGLRAELTPTPSKRSRKPPANRHRDRP